MDIHRQLEALAAGLDIRKAVESVGEYVKAPAEEIIKVGDISQFEGCPVSFFIASALLSALSSLPHKASGSDVSALFPKEFMAAIEAVESLERPQIQWVRHRWGDASNRRITAKKLKEAELTEEIIQSLNPSLQALIRLIVEGGSNSRVFLLMLLPSRFMWDLRKILLSSTS
jgi:hypothetical protein